MRTSSAKSKGRRACAEAREAMLRHAPELQPDDIRVVPSGVPGEDLWLSPAARTLYPFAMELKNVEKLNFWDAIKQAETHAKGTLYTPLVVFRRNNEKLRMIVDFEQFLSWYRGAK